LASPEIDQTATDTVPARDVCHPGTGRQAFSDDARLLPFAPTTVTLGTCQNFALHRLDVLTHVRSSVLSGSDGAFYMGPSTALTDSQPFIEGESRNAFP